MAWGEKTVEMQREEFVRLAQCQGANRRELCGRFGISPTTGYKWIRRQGLGFSDRSRRPHSSPAQTPIEIEQIIVELRAEHPSWGGRKLRRRLEDLGHQALPSPSTITQILRRRDLLGARAGTARDWQRFEREAPNELWQMDFKGHFGLSADVRCHPLTLIDDHSRYSLEIAACSNERLLTVQGRLTAVFERYGLPDRLLCDNGPPWGSGGTQAPTRLEVWLIRLGVGICHGAPFHPQTQGKLERFHRTLKVEVIHGQAYKDLVACQRSFDIFRHSYNHHRPHEAHELDVPASKYRPSQRQFPSKLLEPEYDVQDAVRKVCIGGELSYKGHCLDVPKSLVGQHVGIRPSAVDGVVEVRFFGEIVAQVNLRYNSD
jgi:transposase InsO family protein